jgi:hypothetical protein
MVYTFSGTVFLNACLKYLVLFLHRRIKRYGAVVIYHHETCKSCTLNNYLMCLHMYIVQCTYICTVAKTCGFSEM